MLGEVQRSVKDMDVLEKGKSRQINKNLPVGSGAPRIREEGGLYYFLKGGPLHQNHVRGYPYPVFFNFEGGGLQPGSHPPQRATVLNR